MNAVPNAAYENRALGDVCTLQRGFDLPTKERRAGKYPLITSSGPTDTHDEAKVIGPGVVTGRSGTIGNVFFVEDDFWPLNTALYVKDFHGNDERYVFYLLQFFDLVKFASGAGVPTLNRNHVHSEVVQVASSVDEQKRIVAVLDQAFAALESARAHAEANLADSGELLRSVQISAAADHNDWITAEISTIIKVRSGDFLPSKAMDAAGIIPVFGGNGQTGLHNESNLKGRNILIGRVGAKCGNVRVVDGPIWLTDNAFHVSKLYRDFDLDFLALLLSNADLRTTANQAAQPAISGTTIGVVKVRFPDSIEDQKRHVMRVRSIETKTLELVEAYERKLSEITNLRQSLLQKAFAGQLA